VTRRTTLLPGALLVGALALALAACDPVAPEPGGSSASPSASASTPADPSPAPDPLATLPADAVLGVAVVADIGDATAQLTEVVHRSYAWDSSEGAPLAALMTSGCQGALDASVYADQLWSFAAIDVTVAPLTGTWPTDRELGVAPTTDFLSLASDGALVELPGAAPESPHCDRSRAIVGAGSGRLIVGFHGDTDAVGAAGHFTRWANHRYGFMGSDILFSGCHAVVTELGASLGGGVASWAEQSDASTCTTGTGLPEDTDS